MEIDGDRSDGERWRKMEIDQMEIDGDRWR